MALLVCFTLYLLPLTILCIYYGVESADGEYEHGSGIIQFDRGDVISTHTIVINDDSMCEKHLDKYFSSHITLNSSSLYINVTVPQATVSIEDTEEKECGMKQY